MMNPHFLFSHDITMYEYYSGIFSKLSIGQQI